MASTTTQPDYPGMLPPPPGVTPNITDPESIGWKLVVAGIVCPVITLVFWTLRVYTARHILRKFHLDDWLITASLILAIGLSVVDISQTKYGMGVHMWEVTPADFQHSIIVGLPASIFYNLSTLCVKASILFFYLRFAAANQAFRVTVYVLLFVVAGYSLNAAFSFLYLCTPIHKLWDLATPGSCVDLYSAFLASAAINAATDVVILLLPSWLLWPLRLRWRHKVAVSLVMMTGGFVCAVSFFRLASIPLGKDNMDTTWQYCINNIWCLVELYVGIVCACLPCLRPFVKEHFPSIFSASPDSDGNSSPESGGFGSSLFARQRRRRQVSLAPVSDHASLHSQDKSCPPSSSNSGSAGSAREKEPVPAAAEVEIPTSNAASKGQGADMV